MVFDTLNIIKLWSIISLTVMIMMVIMIKLWEMKNVFKNSVHLSVRVITCVILKVERKTELFSVSLNGYKVA
jgi:hypothetical protein